MHKPKRLRQQRKKGAAVVELAVCLPAVVLLVMGAIECCSMIFLRQALHVTAYEGIRVAIREESNTADVIARCNQILTERSVNGATITIDPNIVENVDRGNQIRIDVDAPCGTNSILPLQFFGGSNMNGAAIMIKE